MHTRASVSKAGARVFVGLVFAVTAAAKAADYYGFIEKAAYYRGFSYDVLTFGAWATILVEVLLAALFLGGLGLRRVAGPLAMFVLLLFSGLIAYAWKRYGIDDCACLGGPREECAPLRPGPVPVPRSGHPTAPNGQTNLPDHRSDPRWRHLLQPRNPAPDPGLAAAQVVERRRSIKGGPAP